MSEFERFKHKANVLMMSGFSLATPLGMQITGWLLTGFHFNANFFITLPISIFLARLGYIIVCRSQGLMEEVDAALDRFCEE